MITDNELIRMEVLAFLVKRSHLKLTGESILRVFTFIGFESIEVEKALCFLEGLNLIQKQHVELGSTLVWNATSAGVLFVERGYETDSTLSTD